MTRLAFRAAALIAVSIWLPVAARAAALPERSTLSYDENVTINTACFDASQRSRSAYQSCVETQLTALQSHPSPDRSGLSAARNRQIEEKCGYLRHIGIGEYNACLKRAMAEPAPRRATIEDPLSPAIAKVFAIGGDRATPPGPAPAALPAPRTILPERPDRIEHAALSPAEIFKKVERSVFVVYATPSLADARARNVMFGSAVAVAAHFLLTNCHVVIDRPVIRIMRGHGCEPRRGQPRGRSLHPQKRRRAAFPDRRGAGLQRPCGRGAGLRRRNARRLRPQFDAGAHLGPAQL
jgi:hypothetical protein